MHQKSNFKAEVLLNNFNLDLEEIIGLDTFNDMTDKKGGRGKTERGGERERKEELL